MTIDARMLAALARLTENEKECLRRRLLQQTAKEMAIELGISPHAVEKRLKMARTKLGLSSSLEAARLLASSHGYQQTGPRAADLPSSARLTQALLHRPQVVGALIVILATAAFLALAAQLAGDDTQSEVHPGTSTARAETDRQFIDLPLPQSDVRITPTAAEMELLVIWNFQMMDKDKSGYIEPGENTVRVLEGQPYPGDEDATPGQTGVRRAIRSEYVALDDKDGDGKWDLGEFRPWLTPHLRAGMPAKIRADIVDVYRK